MADPKSLRKVKRTATRHRSTYQPLRAQTIEHHFTVQPQLTRLRLTTHKQTSNITTQSTQHTTKQYITMTRINISYLLALGLLGTAAVACKYFAFSRQHRRFSVATNAKHQPLTNLSQHPRLAPSPKANRKSIPTPPSPTACATPKSPTSKPKTIPAAQHPPPLLPAAAPSKPQTPRPPSLRSQPSPRPTAASTPRPPSTAPCASPATSSQRAGRTRSSAASG